MVDLPCMGLILRFHASPAPRGGNHPDHCLPDGGAHLPVPLLGARIVRPERPHRLLCDEIVPLVDCDPPIAFYTSSTSTTPGTARIAEATRGEMR